MPSVYRNLTTPLYFPQTLSHGDSAHPPSPILSRYAHAALAKTYKLEMQAQVSKLVNKTASGGPFGRARLDLEEIQREGEEAIQLLADKLGGEEEGKGWFFGTELANDKLLKSKLLVLILYI